MSLHRAAFQQGLARVERAYERLITLSPVFKCDARFVLDDEARTMGFHEDGSLRINNEYFMGLSDDEAAFGLAALVLMLNNGVGNSKRIGTRDRHRWMVAGHHCYNNIVHTMKVGMPVEGSLLNLKYANMTVEEIYDTEDDLTGIGMTTGKMSDGTVVVPGPGQECAELLRIRTQIQGMFNA